MAVPLLLCGIGILFAMCAACFYRMGAADWADEKKFLIDSLEFLASENAKLRELCADVWHLFTEHGAVHPCDLPVVDAVRDRMHELGVEVPDGD